MELIYTVISLLQSRGKEALAQKFQNDLMVGGIWESHVDPKKALCSFLLGYLANEDSDARLSLCPTNDARALVQEIFTDVIPVIEQRLGVTYGV